jgi:hypothetical protein
MDDGMRPRQTGVTEMSTIYVSPAYTPVRDGPAASYAAGGDGMNILIHRHAVTVGRGEIGGTNVALRYSYSPARDLEDFHRDPRPTDIFIPHQRDHEARQTAVNRAVAELRAAWGASLPVQDNTL